MDKENNNKKKITIKAKTQLTSKLILKKNLIYKKNHQDTLVLKNEFKENNKKEINIIKIETKKIDISKKILSIKNISKTLGNRPILKNISFSLSEGEILGLLGPNGSGKSTLFNLIVGKITPTLGKIYLNNENITELPIHKRAKKGISLLEQNKGLFGNMTAYENLYAILELHYDNHNKIENKIFKLLSYFGLQYLSNIKANNMSGGEYKKIVTLQRICNKDIKVLLLDEPMAALDPLSISSIKNFILELRKIGLSIIITDHNFFAIHDILDKCIIIGDGQVMVQGAPKNVMKNEKAIKYYLGSNFGI